MEASTSTEIREAGRVLKASVFYESEYRELCLQQLSSYNPDKMTIGYLTDLVSTTHVFLKLMEHMSKNKHLIVSKKTKKKNKKSSSKAKAGGGNVVEAREENEAIWEALSGPLSALLQGREDLPTDVIPFDAASDESMEEQKVRCMQNIQRALRNKEPGLALALMRAGREVWPEGDSFGEAGAESEDHSEALESVRRLQARLYAEKSEVYELLGERESSVAAIRSALRLSYSPVYLQTYSRYLKRCPTAEERQQLGEAGGGVGPGGCEDICISFIISTSTFNELRSKR